MKIAFDPGHGQDSKTDGLFDPGAVVGAFREADIVLRFALALEDEAQRRGWLTFLTRRDNETAAPLRNRVRLAQEAGCTVLLSIHANAWHTSGANGTETLFLGSDRLARRVHMAALDALKLRDRGVRQRTDLAILRFPKSALLELGFATNPYDLAAMMQPTAPARLAVAICDSLDTTTLTTLEDA